MNTKIFPISLPENLNGLTKKLVTTFANALGEKLYKAQTKYGYDAAWSYEQWIESGECQRELIHHLAKGDPLDVAAYAAFLWHHRKSTKLELKTVGDFVSANALKDFLGEYLGVRTVEEADGLPVTEEPNLVIEPEPGETSVTLSIDGLTAGVMSLVMNRRKDASEHSLRESVRSFLERSVKSPAPKAPSQTVKEGAWWARQLIHRLQTDRDLAWSWHCNLAMAFVDAGGTHEQGNRGAAKFLERLAEIDVVKFPEFRAFEKQWAEDREGAATTLTDGRLRSMLSLIERYALDSLTRSDLKAEFLKLMALPPDDGEVRTMVNDLRAIARTQHASGSLREQLRAVIAPLIDARATYQESSAARAKLSQANNFLNTRVDELETEIAALKKERDDYKARKDAAYLERSRVVALLASVFPSGLARTTIPGWSEDWHGCVYIDLPSGQVSWHYRDSHAFLFEALNLPAAAMPYDGHTTDEKYERVGEAALMIRKDWGHYQAPKVINQKMIVQLDFNADDLRKSLAESLKKTAERLAAEGGTA